MGMGYDVVAATAPFYYGFSPKEVCRYYYDIAEASGSPVLIYNFPGNTHREFDVANPDYIQLFKSGAILGVKQTNYNLFQMERILNLNPDLIAFDGYDETMVAGQALGSSGSIGSTFNMMLPHYKKIFDLETARHCPAPWRASWPPSRNCRRRSTFAGRSTQANGRKPPPCSTKPTTAWRLCAVWA